MRRTCLSCALDLFLLEIYNHSHIDHLLIMCTASNVQHLVLASVEVDLAANASTDQQLHSELSLTGIIS